ncbi:MAG TPA: tRNA (guanosine(37)-N1)-methyltransferase TrmD [Casimicrobiaceae bacterium]|nr:tRNA (guanosine(37)-N1)-methyltransferase TrmD [Casimicrobiaceae bacterium]
MRIDVVTLFPEMVTQACGYGITGRARERGLWQLCVFNPRDFATDAYRTIDDRPYGGGPGMVLMAPPLARALEAARDARSAVGAARAVTWYLSPAGTPLTHAAVMNLVADPERGVTLIAGRYEGVDQRLLDREVDCEVSIGDFVVSGGELPALLLIDAIVRQLPGALNDAESARQDSFADGLLDCPHYTRPERYEEARVPAVLLSGDHAAIRRWRLKQALGRTWQRRPDMLESRRLSTEERALLEEYRHELTDN